MFDWSLKCTILPFWMCLYKETLDSSLNSKDRLNAHFRIEKWAIFSILLPPKHLVKLLPDITKQRHSVRHMAVPALSVGFSFRHASPKTSPALMMILFLFGIFSSTSPEIIINKYCEGSPLLKIVLPDGNFSKYIFWQMSSISSSDKYDKVDTFWRYVLDSEHP